MAFPGHPYLELLLVYMVLEDIKTASEVVNFKNFLGRMPPDNPSYCTLEFPPSTEIPGVYCTNDKFNITIPTCKDQEDLKDN